MALLERSGVRWQKMAVARRRAPFMAHPLRLPEAHSRPPLYHRKSLPIGFAIATLYIVQIHMWVAP